MDNSFLIKRIDSFIVKLEGATRDFIPANTSNLHPKNIVETVHRGGKVFQRHRTIQVRDWEVGYKGALKEGEFVVEKKLPDKYLIRFLRGDFEGKYKYMPREKGKETTAATPPEQLAPIAQPKIKKPKAEISREKEVAIKGFPPFIDKRAAKRIKKLLMRSKEASYLTNTPAKIVAELQGGHSPKKIKFNGIEGVFKSIGSFKDNKWANNRMSLLKEVCSFELSKILRFNFVPPTTIKTMGDHFGSVQKFIPGKLGLKFDKDQRQKIFKSPEGKKLAIFDFIIGNRDRHARNWMYDPAGKKIWAIDNGNVFPTDKDTLHVLSNFINEGGNPLNDEEVNMLIKKRKRILRYINGYCGPEIAKGAEIRIDYMIKNKMVKSYALGES